MQKDERTVWSWSNPECLRALYEAMKEAEYYSDVGRVLSKRFFPENGNPKGLTRNVFIGAFRRGTAQRGLIEIAGYPAEEIHTMATRFLRDPVMNRRQLSSRNRAQKSRAQTTIHKKSTKITAPPPPENAEASTPSVDLEPVRLEDGGFVTTLTLTDSMCKFPIGDPGQKGFAFCGRGVSRGAYCADHAKSAYQPKPKRNRTKKEGDRLRDALRDHRLN